MNRRLPPPTVHPSARPLALASFTDRWQERVAERDPFIDLAAPNWREGELYRVVNGAFEFSVPDPHNPKNASVHRSVSPTLEAEMHTLVRVVSAHFRQDDDATTQSGMPWSRFHSLSVDLPTAVLDLAAVVAGVKPAALLNPGDVALPEVRALFTSAIAQGKIISDIPYRSGGGYIVGSTEGVRAVIAAGERIRNISEGEYPREYSVELGRALGYSMDAISYYLERAARASRRTVNS